MSATQVNRDQIYQDLLSLKKSQQHLTLTTIPGQINFLTKVVKIDEENIYLKNTIPPNMAPLVSCSSSFQLLTPNWSHHFEVLGSWGLLLMVPLPDRVDAMPVREEERRAVSDSEDITIAVHHPFDKSTTLYRKVFDYSKGGLSFRALHGSALLQQGRVLPKIDLLINGEVYSTHKAKVVYIKQVVSVREESYFQVGIQFIKEAS